MMDLYSQVLFYAFYHQDTRNVSIHIVFIPLIALGAVTGLYALEKRALNRSIAFPFSTWLGLWVVAYPFLYDTEIGIAYAPMGLLTVLLGQYIGNKFPNALTIGIGIYIEILFMIIVMFERCLSEVFLRNS